MDSDGGLHGDGGLMRLTGAWEWDSDAAAERMDGWMDGRCEGFAAAWGTGRFWEVAHRLEELGQSKPTAQRGPKMRCCIPLFYLEN